MTPPQIDLAAVPFHRRYLSLVEQIERTYPVALWRSADVDIWPLARMALYLDMYWSNVGGTLPESRSLPMRMIERAAPPLTSLWKSRGDLDHWVWRPRPAHAVFLGDGVSLDHVDGEWRDRYGEPLIAALEKRGLDTFLMQSGDLNRLPWHRSTFDASRVAAWGSLTGRATRISIDLPGHEAVQKFLAQNGERAPSLEREKIARGACRIFATAAAFERILRIVRPKIAFVVAYYADLGPAFLLACRRQGILSVDLQHCPQGGEHKAYGWSAMPANGYSLLPAVFWNWNEMDAAYIRGWTAGLKLPWHRSLHGGHTQLGPFLDETDPGTKEWDVKFAAIGAGAVFEREILVALQPIGGFREQWDALAARIASAPSNWRWWIRRHPAARAYQDAEYESLVSLRLPNVIVDESLSLPLPALLRHMSVLVSRFSGASAEAAAFGVPALFLSEEARGQFSHLIDRGFASIVDIEALHGEIAALAAAPVRPPSVPQPALDETLALLEHIAPDYSQLCRIQA